MSISPISVAIYLTVTYLPWQIDTQTSAGLWVYEILFISALLLLFDFVM